ncbi:XdhC family protein [Flaviflagellibacter deserti]|uniref:XdhC family protein n=1 Tax=Flaviflagellibacter deserti TaxID=2267266 RepID=A0ABV9Z3X1_9HYPH
MMEETGPVIGSPQDDWPLFGLVDDIRPALRAELDRNRAVALVTLFAAQGGAPRGVGAQMLVTSDGASGYLSGGCVEADIVLHGRAVIADGQPRWLVYGQGGPIDIRLPCGGRIEVLIERVLPDDPAAARLITLTEARQPALWLTNGRERMCLTEQGQRPATGDDDVVVRRFDPRQRVVVLGADPMSLALCALATQAGAEVMLVRPNGPLSPPPVAGIAYHRSSPSEALATIGLDPWTAVVIALHDEIHDHASLMAALPSAAGYVGLLGSSRRLPGKLERLRMAGLSDDNIARLKAPIGLSLGGRAPWEIATAIYAEIIATAHAAQHQRTVRSEPANRIDTVPAVSA